MSNEQCSCALGTLTTKGSVGLKHLNALCRRAIRILETKKINPIR